MQSEKIQTEKIQTEKILKIKENISSAIVGKNEIIDLVLTSVLAGGHILLEDVPGTGKTMLSKTLAGSVDADFSRIQFTPDLLPSDITGLNYYNQKVGEFTLRKGAVFTNILLADEINRATPRTQSSLLECMEEHQVTIDGQTYKLNEPFFVIATQNPVETAGTFPLPEAQLDRFLMKLSMGLPSKEEEVQIMNRFMNISSSAQMLNHIEAVCTVKDICDMYEEVQKVYIHKVLVDYIADIVDKTRKDAGLKLGISPRGTLAMLRAARAYAYVQGRDFVIPEDIKKLAVPVFAHRIIPTANLSGEIGKKKIIEDIVSTINVPTEEWGK